MILKPRSPIKNSAEIIAAKNPGLISASKIKYERKRKKSLFNLVFEQFSRFAIYIGEKVQGGVELANREGISRLWLVVTTFTALLAKLIAKGVVIGAKYLSKNRKIVFPVATLGLVLGVFAFASSYSLAVRVTLNDRLVGVVSSQGEFETVKGDVENDITVQTGETYLFEQIPAYSFVVVKKSQLMENEEVYESLYTAAEEELGNTYGIIVDGELVGACKRESDIHDILDEIKGTYATGQKGETAEFLNKIEIKRDMYTKNLIMDSVDLRGKFLKPAKEETYIVQAGERAESIAKKLKTTVNELKLQNPGIAFSSLRGGQKIVSGEPEVRLSVRVVKEITYNVDIPYQVVKIPTNDLFDGYTKIKAGGSKGNRQIKAEVTTINGVEIQRIILEEKTTKQPTTQQLYTGTKKIAPSGKFIWPTVSRYITSPFGPRWGKLHRGVDIAGKQGTPIYAADAGTVVQAGWISNYGYAVFIDHGNGVKTGYHHMYKPPNVVVGQKVYQGMVIGGIGSTGFSTGPHLHFEIILNGTYVNPMNYKYN